MPRQAAPVPAIALFLLLSLGATPPAGAAPLSGSTRVASSYPDPSHRSNRPDIRKAEAAVPLLDRALQIAETIPDRAQKLRALSEIALQLSAVGQQARSQQLFDRVLQLAKRTNADFDPYSQAEVLLDITPQIAQAGHSEQALEIARTITIDFRQAAALNDIATVLAHQGQRAQARSVLLQAVELARGITGDYVYQSNGSCVNYKFEVLSKIAANLSWLAQLDQALQVANEVTGCSSASGDSTQDYQVWAFLGILSHLATQAQVQQTWNQAQAIQNSSDKAQIWGAIALKLLDLQQPASALAVARKLAITIPPSEKPDTIDPLLAGRFAERLLANREAALQAIAVKLAEQRQFAAAMQVADTMTKSTDTRFEPPPNPGFFPNSSPHNATLGAIAIQWAIAGQTTQALPLANQIPDIEAKALTQIAIAGVLQQQGQTGQAANLLQAVSLPSAPSDPQDYVGYHSLSQVAIALVSVGQRDRALQLAETIRNPLARETTLTQIAVKLADQGQIEAAQTLARRLEGQGSQATVLKAVITKLVDLGQAQRALQLAQALSEFDKSQLLTEHAALFAGRETRSQALLLVESLTDRAVKVQVLTQLAAHVSDD